MDDLSRIAIPAASAMAGSISVAWIAKLLITSWLKRYEKAIEEISSLTKDMAVTLHRLKTIEKDINGLGCSIREKFVQVRP